MKLYIILGVIIICVAMLSLGVANIEINNKQYQQNDQSQKTIVKNETKVVTINDMNNGIIKDNVKWIMEYTLSYTKFTNNFYSLNEWQKRKTKLSINNGSYHIFYPVIQAHTNVIKGTTTVSNDVSTMNSNQSEISVKKAWYKFWE